MFHFETQPAPQEKIQDSPAEKERGARVGDLILPYDLNWAELQSTFFAIFLLDCG
jgi:hypothetical protein